MCILPVASSWLKNLMSPGVISHFFFKVGSLVILLHTITVLMTFGEDLTRPGRNSQKSAVYLIFTVNSVAS